MTYIVQITDDAYDDLKESYRWYLSKSNSIEIASRWYDGLVEKLETLSEFADSHSLAHETDAFPYDLRQMLYRSGRRKTHRALFRIVDNSVEVLAIRHLSQDDVTPDDFI